MNRWKIVVAALMVGALSLTLAAPALAAPDSVQMDTCPHTATIASLHQCVSHAEMMGHITSPALAERLHSSLDRADAALARGQAGAAAEWLTAFTTLVQNAATLGPIDPAAAQHLVEHARIVQHALLNPSR